MHTPPCVCYARTHDAVNALYRWTLAFTMIGLLRQELQEFVNSWNSHIIRQSRCDVIGGIPEDLYEMPQNYGKQHSLPVL